MFLVLLRAWDKETIQSPHEELNTRPVYCKNSEFFLCSMLEKRQKHLSLFFLPSSKLTICHILFYKYDATNIADLSSLLDACHIDFVIDLTHRSCCCSVVEHRSTKSEDLMFDSSLELRIFSLSHARDKTKNIFLFI